MNEIKMSLQQIKNETIREFDQGYDHPEDMSNCADASGQEFHCCGDDCPACRGNNECRSSCTCRCSSDSSSECTDGCPSDNLESCTIERIWEMTEHIPPETISDENGTDTHYVKIIRITKTYRKAN